MRVYRDSKLRIPLGGKELPDQLMAELTQELSVKNPAYLSVLKHGGSNAKYTTVPKYLELFEWTEDWFTLPREVTWLEDLFAAHGIPISIVDRTVAVKARFPELRVKLREQQKAAINAFSRSGCLIMPTGEGKTITALALAAKLGMKTLVITHRQAILSSAWQKDIKTAFGIPARKVGLIQGENCSIGRQFTLAMVQTLSKRDLEKLGKKFGFIIVDECHHAASETYTETVLELWGRHRLGITATDKRSDGLESVMHAHMGPTLFRGEPKNIMPFSVYAVDTKCSYKPKKEDEDKPFNYNRCLDSLIDDSGRNLKIASYVAQNYLKNYSLVITHRRRHVPILKRALAAHGVGVATFHGGISQERREGILRGVAKGKIHVVLATMQTIKEGVDCPRLDRLFLATSIAEPLDLTQVIGRVRRKHHDKRDVVVYDFLDSPIVSMYRHFMKRQMVYSELGASVEKANFI